MEKKQTYKDILRDPLNFLDPNQFPSESDPSYESLREEYACFDATYYADTSKDYSRSRSSVRVRDLDSIGFEDNSLDEHACDRDSDVHSSDHNSSDELSVSQNSLELGKSFASWTSEVVQARDMAQWAEVDVSLFPLHQTVPN